MTSYTKSPNKTKQHRKTAKRKALQTAKRKALQTAKRKALQTAKRRPLQAALRRPSQVVDSFPCAGYVQSEDRINRMRDDPVLFIDALGIGNLYPHQEATIRLLVKSSRLSFMLAKD